MISCGTPLTTPIFGAPSWPSHSQDNNPCASNDNVQPHEVAPPRATTTWLTTTITRTTNRCLEIDQSRYLWGVLAHFNMADANPCTTPLPTGADVHLVKFEGQSSVADTKLYQSIIGSLLYIQISTHTDISFAVSHLAQYASNPLSQHM